MKGLRWSLDVGSWLSDKAARRGLSFILATPLQLPVFKRTMILATMESPKQVNDGFTKALPKVEVRQIAISM